MAYEQRDNSGSLFKNDRKQSDNHPDYKGSAHIGGVEYWVSAWLKTGKNGTKFMSFSYTPKDQQQQAKAAPKVTGQDFPGPAEFDVDDSDLPF